jgi:tRNA (Thr-GGU) A37 N-methylase
MEFTMRPIGVIYSPFTDKGQTPIQPSRSQAVGQVEVYPEFAEGLQDVEGFSHIILLYVFHCSTGYTLLCCRFCQVPCDRRTGRADPRGLFFPDNAGV